MTRVAAALLIGVSLLAPACALAQVTGPAPPPPAAGTSPDADTDEDMSSFKLCSAVSESPAWRDTIPVPEGWTAEDCRQWVASFGARAQIGCIFSIGTPKFSWAPIGAAGAVPDPDCGWADDTGPSSGDKKPR